tara:strand:+ start:2180 stop:2410 length:231 start_codon:yes stop_codon:yes gene_type:complete
MKELTVILVAAALATMMSIAARSDRAVAMENQRTFELSMQNQPNGMMAKTLVVDGVHCNYGILIFRDGEITGGCIQ